MATPKPKKVLNKPNKVDDNSDLLCYCCGKYLDRKMFHKSTDPFNSVGYVTYCKNCVEKIARSYDPETQQYHDVTKRSLQDALERLDLPYLDRVWDASFKELNEDNGSTRRNMWGMYIKNIKMPQYKALRWRDSDLFKFGGQAPTAATDDAAKKRGRKTDEEKEAEFLFKKNKKAVIDFVGYDPYNGYPNPSDLPILYAKLLSFLDEETKNDGMKLNAVIQICKEFNQVEKLNHSIDELSSNPQSIINNATLIKNLHDASSKALSSATALAKDNGISVNYNNNKSKGASTLSGKMKKMHEIGLWDAKINTYDIGTSEGMLQVAMINEKARHAQIGYDESIAAEIKDIKVELVEQMTKERDAAVETARRLLLENKDLKEFLQQRGIIDAEARVVDSYE